MTLSALGRAARRPGAPRAAGSKCEGTVEDLRRRLPEAGFQASNDSPPAVECELVEDGAFVAPRPTAADRPGRGAFVDGTLRTRGAADPHRPRRRRAWGLAGSWAAAAVLVRPSTCPTTATAGAGLALGAVRARRVRRRRDASAAPAPDELDASTCWRRRRRRWSARRRARPARADHLFITADPNHRGRRTVRPSRYRKRGQQVRRWLERRSAKSTASRPRSRR